MPNISISQDSSDFHVTVAGADVAETGGDVRVNKAGIKAEVDSEMTKCDADEGFSVSDTGAANHIHNLTYDGANSDANSLRFTK